jgi:Rrf2 family protein
MVALAGLPEGKYAGAGEIAKAIGAPQNYLGKLLQLLVREGLLVSQKGLGGGFRLAKPPEEIALRDIVDPTEHLERWGDCILGLPDCSDAEPCALHRRWKTIRESYLDLLATTRLSECIQRRMVPAAQL